MTKGEFNYLEITIRRGKASRTGRRPTYAKCFENLAEPLFCPINGFINYMKELRKQDLCLHKDSLLFPHKKGQEDFPINRRMITTDGPWVAWCDQLALPKQLRPQGHSGHAMLINTAWVFDQNEEQLLDITNWNSIRNLPEYVETPKENSINIIKTAMSAEQLDEKCYMIYEQ